MRVLLVAASLLLLPQLAGCIEAGIQQGRARDPGGEAAPPTGEVSVLYLAANGQLTPAPAAEGAVPLGWSHPQWVVGEPPAAWTAEPGRGWGILEATAHLTFRARSAAATTAVRDDLSVWWGSTDSVVAHAIAPGPALYAPGDQVTVAMPLEIPRNGLWLGPEEAMAAQVATYTTDGPGLDHMELVVGGVEGSRIAFRAAPHAGEAAARSPTASWSGTHGSDCTEGVNQFLEHTVPVSDVRELRLSAAGVGVQDLDVYVLHQDEVVMRAHGPGTTEVLRLREPNVADLGAEDVLTLQVLGVCAGRLDYELAALV